MVKNSSFKEFDPKRKKKRVPAEQWGPYKEIIKRKYVTEKKTLNQVKKEMEEEENFVAETRSYVHMLGKWEIVKYNVGSKKPPKGQSGSPDTVDGPSVVSNNNNDDDDDNDADLDDVEVDDDCNHDNESNFSLTSLELLRLLADVFLSVSDSGSFGVLVDLCNAHSGNILPELIACLRAVQTKHQADTARHLLQREVNNGNRVFEEGVDEAISPVALLVDIEVARTYDHHDDVPHAVGQIKMHLGRITTRDQDGSRRLRILERRGPTLDMPLLSLIGYLVKRSNETRNHTPGDAELINEDGITHQFVAHQLDGLHPPGYNSDNPARELPCIQQCIGFCDGILSSKKRFFIPGELCTLPPVYQIFGAIWGQWISLMASPGRRSEKNAWADESHGAQRQLGISATELLLTVVCMIMAKGAACRSPRNALAQARLGVSSVAGVGSMSPTAIFYLFLRQFRNNNEWRMLAPREPVRPLPAEQASNFRRFVWSTLRNPEVQFDFTQLVHPLWLATPEQIRSIEAVYHVSARPTSTFPSIM
ncbi:hypothetical protein QBC47DRAFT_67443 [Echria macrotheca]|uniref:Clr5 domain-containing protein n=1 Tax=Echria macrotheca TaxID=438768 RepID=A0AAJ0B5Y5_9PEZI|nr:hypothetical protein QBC47DRAFT_67443 [Echria macrotheca]